MILLIGDPRDPHVTGVAAAIASAGAKVAIFSRYSSLCALSVAYQRGRWEVGFEIGGHRFAGEEVEAVWWRQKPFRYIAQGAGAPTEGEDFADREWYQLLQALPDFLTVAEQRWINHPALQLRANLKPLQLRWAQAAGLPIADTAFTNMAGAVTGLAESAAEIVYKTFSGHVFTDGRFIFTSKLGGRGRKLSPERIAMAPGIYQAYVEKHHELRVYFVDEVFRAVKVDSQRRKKTRVDWRMDQSTNIYQEVELETGLEERLCCFARAARLRFGAIDGIVDPSGQFHFLECNPAGQWLWIEEFTGVPVTSMVAQGLLRTLPDQQ